MPPSGLPDVFLEGGPESLRQLVLRYAKGRGPFTTARGERAVRSRCRADAGRARARGAVRARRAAARAAPSASGAIPTCCAACAARRWRRSGARSSRSSRRRSRASCRAGTGSTGARPARGARPAAGAAAAGRALGERAAAAPRPELPARAPRCADRERRGRLGRRRPGSRGRVLPRGRRALGQVPAAPKPEGVEHDAIRAALGRRALRSTCSRKPGSRRTRRSRRCGISSGPAR